MTNDKQNFDMRMAANIKSARKALNMNQHEFARALGVTQPRVSEYERGKGWMSPYQLAKMRDEMGIDLDTIIPRISEGDNTC